MRSESLTRRAHPAVRWFGSSAAGATDPARTLRPIRPPQLSATRPIAAAAATAGHAGPRLEPLKRTIEQPLCSILSAPCRKFCRVEGVRAWLTNVMAWDEWRQ